MSSAIQEHVIKTSVLEACSRNGIPHESALRHQLEAEALIADGTTSYVRAASGVTLDERISELAKNAKFSKELPPAKPTVPSTDMTALSQNLEAIASGKVTVR